MDSTKSVMNMLNGIESLGLVGFVQQFDDDSGFMWSNDNRVYDIGNSVLNDGHSGASFACCLRKCQYLLKNPNVLEEFKANYQNNKNTPLESIVVNDPEYMFYEENNDNN